jgi:hypothetical protein
MCLAVVAVVAMLVVGWGSAMATAAEEADDWLEIAPRNLETRIYESTGKQAIS